MANALQVRAIKNVVDQYSAQYGLLPHKAFLYLVIERYLAELELNSIDIEEAIVDGGDDCGIDAIVISDDEEGRPKIYFFQSKYSPKEDAFERNFEGDALDKIQSAVNDFVLKGRINAKYQNARLVDRLQSVKNLLQRNPEFEIVLCSNTLPPAIAAKTRLEEFVSDANDSVKSEHLHVRYLNVEEVAQDLIAPEQETRIDLNLQISGKYLTEDTGNVRLFVGAVNAARISELVEEHGNGLFERNVRGYLGPQKLNQSIYETATSQISPYFVYMNNGITITCEKFSHAPIADSPTLEIANAQVVNGQQTARSLHRAFKEGKLKPDTKVLVRLVETSDRDLLMKIVDSTNSQTKVTSRDLRSNDETQRLIEKSLESLGYFYEARKGKYKGKDLEKRVDAEIAAQAYYAIFKEQPALAKDKKKYLFGDRYDDVFDSSLEPANLLYAYKLLRCIQRLNGSADSEKYSFLKDAALHTAALIHRIGGRNVTDGELPKEYTVVIDSLLKLVRERQKKEGDKYEHRRTFKDPETYGRAVQILENAKS